METAVRRDGEQTGRSRFTSAVGLFDGWVRPARPHRSRLSALLPVVQMLLLSEEPLRVFAIAPAPSPAQII